MRWKIYHNPRCSKSRQTLALLQEKGVDLEIIEYVKHPVTDTELCDLRQKLGFDSLQQLARPKESLYKELGLAKADEDTLLKALVANPALIERPVVVNGERAVIGRPPENVLELLD